MARLLDEHDHYKVEFELRVVDRRMMAPPDYTKPFAESRKGPGPLYLEYTGLTLAGMRALLAAAREGMGAGAPNTETYRDLGDVIRAIDRLVAVVEAR